jgi:hypothetical protein
VQASQAAEETDFGFDYAVLQMLEERQPVVGGDCEIEIEIEHPEMAK